MADDFTLEDILGEEALSPEEKKKKEEKKKQEREYQETKRFAREFLERYDEDRPVEEDFSDVYSREDIRRDIEAVEKREAGFLKGREEISNISRALEVVIPKSLEMFWLTEDIFTHPTSKFDDIKRGIDAVLEFDPEQIGTNRMAVGIDFTSDIGTNINGKVGAKVENFILHTRGQTVKYFEAEYSYKEDGVVRQRRGHIETVPVVVSIKRDDLQRLFYLHNAFGTGRKDIDATKEIAEHNAKTVVLLEILEQLRLFSKLYERFGENKKAKRVGKMIDILSSKLDADEVRRVSEDDRLVQIRELCKFYSERDTED